MFEAEFSSSSMAEAIMSFKIINPHINHKPSFLTTRLESNSVIIPSLISVLFAHNIYASELKFMFFFFLIFSSGNFQAQDLSMASIW